MRTTVFRRPLVIPLFCLLLLVDALFGGEPGQGSPIAVHASVTSLPAFIKAVDNCVVRATADTSLALPPGTIEAILRAHIVIPTEGWHQEQPMHILFLNNRPSPKNMVLILHADSLDAFAKGMTDNHIDVARENGALGGRDMLVLGTVGGQVLFAVATGDGQVALAADADAISVALDHLAANAWHLLHNPAADLSLFFPLPGLATSENPMAPVKEQLARNRDGLLVELKQMGINPRVGGALLSFVENRLPELGREMLSLRAAVFDCRFDKETLQVSMRIQAESESFIGRMGGTLTRSAVIDGSALDGIREKSHFACVGAAPARILPDFGGWMQQMVEDFETIFPNRDEAGEQTGGLAAFLSLAEADWALSGWVGDDGMTGTLRLALPVAEFLPSSERLVESLNTILAATIADPTLHVRVVADNANGRAYRLAFTDPARVDTLLHLLRVGNPAFTLTRGSLERPRLAVGGDAEYVTLTMTPTRTPSEEAVATGKTTGLNTDPVRYLPHRQGGFALMDADMVLQAIFTSLIREFVSGMEPGHAALHIAALAETFPTMLKTGETIEASLGASEGDFAIGLALPYRVVGAALANYEIFTRATGGDNH